MPNRPRQYYRPTHLASALELLRKPNTVPLLFGPRVPDTLYEGAEAVIDLSQLGLDYIHPPDAVGVIRIGALTPLSDIIASPVIRSHANGVLADAAHMAVASGMREVATVGGAWLSPAGPPEVRLALEALRADVVAEHTLPLEIKLPPLSLGSAGALERIARSPRDEAIVAVVVVRHSSSAVRVCVGPAPFYSIEAPSADSVPTLEGWQPISDFRASADYRQAMAGVLARRALETARQRSLAKRLD